MQFTYWIWDFTYALGARLLFGRGAGPLSTLRVIAIGVILGVVGSLALSVATLSWAVFVWLTALWNPTTRPVSGFYFGMTILLGLVYGAVTLAGLSQS